MRMSKYSAMQGVSLIKYFDKAKTTKLPLWWKENSVEEIILIKMRVSWIESVIKLEP